MDRPEKVAVARLVLPGSRAATERSPAPNCSRTLAWLAPSNACAYARVSIGPSGTAARRVAAPLPRATATTPRLTRAPTTMPTTNRWLAGTLAGRDAGTVLCVTRKLQVGDGPSLPPAWVEPPPP